MPRSIAQSSDLVPHHASDLPPAPWLIFAPHADDETLGMGGTMILARRQGIEINLIVLTDGARGGPPEETELIAIREQEARTLAATLGLGNVEFWRQPDGHLTITETLVERVAEVLSLYAPATVFFPSPLELNADHRVAAALIWQGLQRKQFSGSIYAYEITVAHACNCLIDITAVAAEKRRLLDCYPSQLSQNNYVAVREALDTARTYTLPLQSERAESFVVYPPEVSGLLLTPFADLLRRYWSMIAPHPMPLVSVIVRTKDRPHLLQEALQSVALQSYPNIELVVVNDGGCDVADLVQPYLSILSNVRYRPLTENQGRATAGNVGLDVATGDYLILLDDDDLLEPDHIAGLVHALQDQPSVRAAYAGVRLEGNRHEPLMHEDYDPSMLRSRNLFPIHAVLFSAGLVKDGCRFDPSLIAYEDWDFWLQVAEHTNFLKVEQVSAIYRAMGNSGYGAFNAESATVLAGRKQILQKWTARWSSAQLVEQIEVAWSAYRALEAEHLQLDASFRALAQQVEKMQASTSYRLGRWLTAPWRWLRKRGKIR